MKPEHEAAINAMREQLERFAQDDPTFGYVLFSEAQQGSDPDEAVVLLSFNASYGQVLQLSRLLSENFFQPKEDSNGLH